MIIIKIFGGLGNQLFQYAIGRKLSILHNTKLLFDISDFNKYENMTKIGIGIKKFNINFQVAKRKDLDLVFFIKKKLIITLIKKISSRLFSYINNLFRKNYFYETNYFKFYEKYILYKNAYFHGFWQNEKYFSDIRKTLVKEINFRPTKKKHSCLLNLIKNKNSVAVHIRRGDKTLEKNKKMFPLLGINYFIESMNYMQKNLRKPFFLFFSDDISWVKVNIPKSYSGHFVSGFSETEDLISMKSCKHNIISNSTFSWWAAWLNVNKNKIIVCPKKWATINNKPFNPSLSQWIKI